MKQLLLTLLPVLFISCGKSTYYAYEFSDEINHHYSYCTLEITKTKAVIYRAKSDKYYIYPNNTIYAYLYSPPAASTVNDDSILFAQNASDLFYMQDFSNPTCKQTSVNVFGENPICIDYKKTMNDTIIHTNNETFLDYAKNEYGLRTAGIKWFPEYMVKIDKIDYQKFGSSIQHMNLKNPEKQK